MLTMMIILVLSVVTLSSRPTNAAYFDAVGSSDFYRLVVEDGLFVDRSMFIAEYFRKWRMKLLIVRPRWFGKSINLDMLKRFMEIEVDEAGNRLAKSARKNRVLFTGGNVTLNNNNYLNNNNNNNKTVINNNNNTNVVTLQPLAILNCTSLFQRQGTIPVVYVSFKNLTGTTYERFEQTVKTYVSDLYGRRYNYARKNLTSQDDKDAFDRYATGRVSVVELANALNFLTRIVQRYFDDRKVHLLVDDYDTPLRNILNDVLNLNRSERKFNETDAGLIQDAIRVDPHFRTSVRLIAGLIGNALENNPSVDQALLTGRFPLAKTDMSPELKNVHEYSLMNKPFSEYYGFYETEVGRLAGKTRVREKRKDMKRWYKGYNFAANVLYNPYSTLRCLQNDGRCADYWASDDSDLRFVRHLLTDNERQKELGDLFDDETVEMDIEKNSKFSYEELANGDLTRYLLFAGYLTPLWRKAKKTPIKLKVPNYELKSVYRRTLLNWAKERYKLNANRTERAAKYLDDDNIHEFRLWLRNNV